jgi:hypothetical protein
MSLIDQILTCVDKIIPTLRNDTTKEWKRLTEEGKALCKELEQQSQKPKEDTDSTE